MNMPQTRTETADALHDRIDQAAETTTDTVQRGVHRLRDRAHSAVEHQRARAERARHRAVQAHRQLGQYARTRPVTLIALAAVIGATSALLLSHLNRRNSSEE